MPTVNNEGIQDSTGKKEYSFKEEVDVEFGQLPRGNKMQIPGYLSVLINNCPLEAEEIKFFGVNNQGAEISGKGVKAESVEDNEDEKIVYFDMDQLVKTGQYTEDTVEGVITINNQEIGRESVNTDSAIYLG